MRIIVISSGKGGVGKTTVAINLASTLVSKFEKQVLLIDCNVTTPHVSLYLGMDHLPVTLNDVLRGEASISDAIYPHYAGMKILPAALPLHSLQGIDVIKLEHVLTRIKKSSKLKELDFVILDAAPGLGREAMAALRAANEIIFVATPFIPSIIDVVKTHNVAKELELQPVGIVLNMTKSSKNELKQEEVEALAELPVLASIPMSRLITESIISRKPAVLLRKHSNISLEFIKLAAELTGRKEVVDYHQKILPKLIRFFRG